MEVITQTTLIMMLIAYIAGLITAMMLLVPRSRSDQAETQR